MRAGRYVGVHSPSASVSSYSLAAPVAALLPPCTVVPEEKASPSRVQPPASVVTNVTLAPLAPRSIMTSIGWKAADHVMSSPRVSTY